MKKGNSWLNVPKQIFSDTLMPDLYINFCFVDIGKIVALRGFWRGNLKRWLGVYIELYIVLISYNILKRKKCSRSLWTPLMNPVKENKWRGSMICRTCFMKGATSQKFNAISSFSVNLPSHTANWINTFPFHVYTNIENILFDIHMASTRRGMKTN